MIEYTNETKETASLDRAKRIEALLESLKKNGISQKRIADDLGITGQAVYKWKKSGQLGADALLYLAKASNRSPDWIMSGTQEPPASYESKETLKPNTEPYLPIISFEDAANGRIPGDAEQYQIAPFDAPMFGPNAFIVRMDDDSMESNSSDSIKTGSLLFIDSPAPSAIKPGKTVVAMLDGDSKAVIRKYRDRGLDENGRPMFELAPLNDDYNKTTVNASTPGKIIGLLKMRQILS